MTRKRFNSVSVVTVVLVLILIGVGCLYYMKAHTFTLSGDDAIKRELIQPTIGVIWVTGTADTSVVFTDIASGESFEIGYITPGMGDRIRLERGKWYRVEGLGDLTIRPVNVRSE